MTLNNMLYKPHQPIPVSDGKGMMGLTSNETIILFSIFFLKYEQKFDIIKRNREVLKGNRPGSTWHDVHYNEAEKIGGL